MPPSSRLSLGGRRGGGELTLTDQERAYHVHIMGATGTGKSRLLEHMIRQDIARGRGLCLIDPHGTLSDRVEAWCASRGMGRVRRIHLVKPGSGDWLTGFNPVGAIDRQTPEVRVDAMVAACAQVWGGEDLNQTPRLKKVLRALFFALAAQNLTLAEALLLLRSADPDGTRRALTADLSHPVFGFVWGELNGLARREFAEYTESTISRLTEFLASPAIRLMIGQQANALDFRHIMDEGEVVLVNLGSRTAFSYDNARVLGTLLINDLFLTALGRDERTAATRPFTLYLDEAHDFLSGDVEKILDQTRKFGLHAVLAHQRLGQLRERGESVFNAVMGSTRTKIVFGLESDEDAGEMARQVLRGEVDLERPKHILDKPVVVDEVPYWFENGGWSETDSHSQSTVEAYGWSQGGGGGSATSEAWDVDESGQRRLTSATESQSQSDASSESGSYSSTESYSHSRTESRGWTEGRVAIRKMMPTATYSLEEQLHLSQLKLRSLPNRHAIIKRQGKAAEEFVVPLVANPISSRAMLDRFHSRMQTQSPYVCSVVDAERAVIVRQEALALTRQPAAEFWSE